MTEAEPSSPAWDNGQWKNTKADLDGAASHCSSTVTRCPVPSGDEGEDTRYGDGSGSGSGGRSSETGGKTQDSSSRDDVSSSDDAQRAEGPEGPEATPSVDDGAASTNFASLQRDGPSASCGSKGHPDQCKPCAFYCYSLRGCRNGDGCVFCHLFHESKLQQRREEWKRAQREKRGRMRKTAREEAQASNVTGVPPPASSTPAQPTLVHHSAKVAPAFVQGVSASTCIEEERPVAKVAYVREGEAGKDLTNGAQRKNMTAAAVKAGAAGPPSGLAAAAGQKKQKKPLKAQKPPQESLGMPMHVPAAWDPMSLPSVLGGGNMPMDYFSYTPSSVVAGVGQAVELWPPVPIASAGMVFAVSPALPTGLTLDKNTGLISGIAQEGTDGSRQYFVTACEPRSVVPNIRISMVDIKVINVQAPGYTMSSLVQPEPGVTVVTLREDPNSASNAENMAELLQMLVQQSQHANLAKLSALAAQQEQVAAQQEQVRAMLGGQAMPAQFRQWWDPGYSI